MKGQMPTTSAIQQDARAWWGVPLPHTWQAVPMKYVVSLKSGEHISADRIFESGSFAVFGGNGQRGYTDSYTHDGTFVLIGRQGALCGNVNYASGKFWASEHAVVATPKMTCPGKWLGEMLRAMNLGQYSMTAAQPGLAVDMISNLWIPLPEPPERVAIANFLDRETAEADALIAKYERLIELLEEKRVALITRAVTKGLDPSVTMKHSGIECIGQIPSHWETRRIKFVAALRYGLGQPPPEMAGGLPLIRATNIDQGLISEAGMVYVDPNCVPKTRNAFLRTGEILIVRSGALTGDSAIVPVQYDGAVAGFDIVITGRHVDARFLAASVLMPFVRSAQLDLLKTRAAQPHLNVEDVGSILITLPPPTEQERIVQYIIKHDQKLQSAQRVARRAIALVQEHRSALITAAVTGQIDVTTYRSAKPQPSVELPA